MSPKVISQHKDPRLDASCGTPSLETSDPMAKRRKSKASIHFSGEQLAQLIADAGMGISDDIGDTGFWLEDFDSNRSWYMALQALDVRGDKKPLIGLLQSGPAPKTICLHIADFLDRYEFVRPHKTGPVRTPTYTRSSAMSLLESTILEVRGRPRAMRLQEALVRAAGRNKVPLETLSEAYAGKHGGLNRARRGRPPKLT
jgi:hypothetical protein